MSVSGQSDHFEASFNIVGPNDIKTEGNGDELGDNTNMVVDGVATGSDADKAMVVDGPASGSDGNTAVKPTPLVHANFATMQAAGHCVR